MSKTKSEFEELIIESNNGSNSVDITRGARSIDYYEDIFSPIITVKITVITTGDAVAGKDGKGAGIYNGLPLRGGERVAMKIAANSSTNKALDFSTKVQDYLYVSSITNVVSEGQKEAFTLNLVPREAITNETIRVSGKYPTSAPIDVSVKKIIEDYLKTDKPVVVDQTSNTYGFYGNLRRPFNVLVWLASKSVPKIQGATAGFLFFQTQDGFNFRSIDELISENPKATYNYTDVNKSSTEENNDFNILTYTVERNQNLLEKLRLGAYSSFRMGFNLYDGTFTDPQKGVFAQKDYLGKTKNLGKEPELPKISNSSNQTLGDIPSRIITQVIDVGTMEKGVSTTPNADPFKYQSQSVMRYNLLFTQTLNMTVPLNTNLRAGDIIECQFPKISRGGVGEYDDEQSGLYMIKELCHHFDDDYSLTSMKLVRDTYGKYGTNNK
jgi:hypothetical protein